MKAIMSDQFSGKVLADKYRVDSLMREGGLGNFYHGTHLAMEKPVTIKILSPALAVDENIVNRFSGEAKTLSRLSHPNILNVTDYGSDKNGTVFIVMEDAAGESLKDVISRDGQFSLERANRIVRQIAAALSVAHAGGVVHRNLSSENILLTETPSEFDFVKVLGLASADSSEENILEEDISADKAEYLAPEQCAVSSEADERSDVYSLGVILYEMLAGEVPFRAKNPTDVMLKHVQEPPLPLSAFRGDLPNEVNQVILNALAKNPDSRYQTPNDLAAALNRTTLASSEKTPAARMNLSASPVGIAAAEEKPQNNIWKTAFIVLAGVSVLSAFFIYITNVKQTNPTTQLQTDANSSPVQPVNPATGSSEQSLSNMGAYSTEMMSNTNTVNGMPQVVPGGSDNPWDRGVPPRGAPPQGNYNYPYPVQPGGTYVDPTNPNGSIFMQDGNTYVLVPKGSNSNVNTQPANTKKPAANANVQTPPSNTAKPSQSPAANTAAPPAANTAPPPKTAKPTPTPKTTPKTPSKTQPSSTDKRSQSGKEQDTE